MPTRPPSPCVEPGCRELTAKGRCGRHQRAHQARYEARRGSAASRGYDGAWRRFRLRILRARGWTCEECGRRPADPSRLHVHHQERLADGGARLDPSNVRVLCEACHNALPEHRERPRDGGRRRRAQARVWAR